MVPAVAQHLEMSKGWADLITLPYGLSDIERRDTMWHQMDTHGHGYLSLLEVQRHVAAARGSEPVVTRADHPQPTRV